MSFCQNIRKETNDYFEASFHHPFVKGMVNRTLPIEEQIEMKDCYADENIHKHDILQEHFIRRCYYEQQFWELSWTLQHWESEVGKHGLIKHS